MKTKLETGLGPTLEFYALVSNELQRSDLNLWNDAENSYRNQEIKETFAIVPAILKSSKNEALNLDGCQISDLSLNFVLPGHPNIELLENGQNIPVTIYNLHEYISLVSHWFLVKGVTEQFESFKEGFNSIFSIETLKLFYPEELENVFLVQEIFKNGIRKCWLNVAELIMDLHKNRLSFLQFITGTPKLPVGGFKSLTPPFTIVAKKIDENQNPDDFLPSVMTCVNYLKLPEYSNREIMKEKLKIAANEGSLSFHLS
ncbi:hypothetical protein PVAND_001032 [Polypedilum vanderplanki]|uniref:E3 ubiquitin-protein ligase n=1 Tax=Polypedilum vanderplanki TaxID=319348 RepID=A0A9J6BLP6_POLVA|nr:hypothetical protein PVAND_001032 [Polypedilum vanderplanki]